MPALQATGRLARLGAGALAGRTSLRLGATWTTLVIAQVAFSVGVLPLAAELAWGTLRTSAVGPGFAAEEFATARVALEEGPPRANAALFGNRQRELARRLLADPGILGVAAALRPPGEEPWVFVDIEGRDAPTETLNGRLPGFAARFNQVEASFFEMYQVPTLTGRGFAAGDVADGGRCGHRQPQLRRHHRPRRQRARTPFPLRPCDGRRVAGRPGSGSLVRSGRRRRQSARDDRRTGGVPSGRPGQIHPAQLQLRLRGGPAGLAERLRDVAASVDPALHVDEVRTLAEIYRDHRFGDNLGAITIGAVTGSVLLLSAAGLYALMAFTVAQRRREIGIRSALGAQPGQLVAAVFRRAFWQIGAGSAVGMLAAYLVGRYVPIEQIGGLPIPGVLPGAAAFMLLVGVLAALGPARRGLRIDPTEALRSE